MLSTFTGIAFMNTAEANPTPPQIVPMANAYIRNDGTIEPSTLPIERSGNHYFLVGDIINYTINIQIDDVVFDGNGHSLTFSQNGEIPEHYTPKYGGPAILISNRTNIIIRNVSFVNYLAGAFTGISIENSSNIIILQNSMGNVLGVHMELCTDCSIIGNNGGVVHVVKSTFVKIAYNRISDSYFGINIRSTKNISITRNELVNNEAGIMVLVSNVNSSIFENNFLENEVGIEYNGASNLSDGSFVFNNYWNNNEAAIKSIDDNGMPYASSGVDQSPLESPVSVIFNASLFVLPSFAPMPSSTPFFETITVMFPVLVIAVIITVAVVITVTVFVIYKKNKRCVISV